MDNLSLSIIIPVYNKSKYLERCLTSIIKQSYKHFEAIIINDGSSDDSESIAERFQVTDGRIKLFTFVNGGVSIARNRGLSKAQGTYIMFIDADDWIEPDYLQHVMGYVEKHNADLYVWGITKQAVDREFIITPLLRGMLAKEEFLSSFIEEQYAVRKGLYGYISNKLLSRKVIQENNIQFNAKLKQLEDYDFFLTYYNHVENVYVFDEIGYHYVTGTEFSSGAMIKHVDFLAMIEIHLKCKRLLECNHCLTKKNQQLINNAICGLVISMFLEIPKIDINLINQLLKQIERYEEVTKVLKSYKTDFKYLKSLILDRRTLFLYVYLYIWKCYLYVRRRI